MLPKVNTACLNVFLEEMAKEIGSKSAIIVMDGAGWHKSADLKVPQNIEIIYLPPYSPELNPIERLWLYIKQNVIKNHIYENLVDLEESVSKFILQNLRPQLIQTVCRISYL